MLVYSHKYHKPYRNAESMAKSDSFFIRAGVTTNDGTFVQSEIDLGSYVNLGVSKSTLLRIHNIAVQYADSNSVSDIISDQGDNMCSFQLTTQSQTGLVYATDKSVVASGSLAMYNTQTDPDGSVAADFNTGFISDSLDISPQRWTNGYLIGVDTLFLGTSLLAALETGQIVVSVVMECTLENATQANSVALALSQQ
jgi:hypothetical protein